MTALEQLPGNSIGWRRNLVQRSARSHEKVDMIHIRLSGAIDASRAETRAMFEQVFNRLDALTATRKRPRRLKKP